MGVTGNNGGASSSVAAVGSYPNYLRISMTSSLVYNSLRDSSYNAIYFFLSSMTALWAYLSFSRVLISF